MPDADTAILRSGDDDGELGVKADDGHIVCVTLQGLHASLVLVVPHLDEPKRE